MRRLFFTLFIFGSIACFAQENGFPYGQATYRELEMSRYELDTAATALMLDEFGLAYVNNEYNIVFQYHVRIKILKLEGVSYGTFEIPLRKYEGRAEKIIFIKGSSFNLQNGSISELKLESKNIYTEKFDKYFDVKKFAIPNVKTGSIVEVFYELESPFTMNFRSWEFQSEIPKQRSEYKCLIPGIYHYNISLKGFLELSKNESELAKGRFSPAGRSPDTLRLHFGMKDIPSFKGEEYMTASSNFLSSINFELSEILYLDGRRNKITKEWKDVDQELWQHPDFGLQIKRGRDILGRQIKQIIAGETDELVKAKKVYEFIQGWYRWNNAYGKFAETGIKKAFESRVGNVGDVNLSLVAALQSAGLRAQPVILSTRENGMATELYPVLSDFNYVVARTIVQNKSYLLDATDDFYPFGLLPERCLNGKGRAFDEKESSWESIIPSEKRRIISVINLTLDADRMSGTLQYTYSAYAAVKQKKRLAQFAKEQEYIDSLRNQLPDVGVKNFTFENIDIPGAPLVVNMEIEIEAQDLRSDGSFLFNPFIIEKWKKNPFRPAERLYPVDFGVPLEEIVILNLTYDDNYGVDEIPAKVALALPQNGGRYTCEIRNVQNKISMTSTLMLAKPVFTPQEYHYLKELFNNVIATEQTQLVFKKKK